MERLASVLGMDVLTYAILSNHLLISFVLVSIFLSVGRILPRRLAILNAKR